MLKAIEELIAGRYGSKRGLLNYFRFHHWWANLDWAKKPADDTRFSRLVFVCQGNICRSALASAVADRLGVANVSFGLNTTEGSEAAVGMIEVAATMGYDLIEHRSSHIKSYEPAEGDLICLMEPGHRELALAACPELPPATLLGLWGSPPRSYIHDPLCCNPTFYATCAEIIEGAVKRLAEQAIPQPPASPAQPLTDASMR